MDCLNLNSFYDIRGLKSPNDTCRLVATALCHMFGIDKEASFEGFKKSLINDPRGLLNNLQRYNKD